MRRSVGVLVTPPPRPVPAPAGTQETPDPSTQLRAARDSAGQPHL